ncbi:MAG: S-adenosylmethionine:tRNA ribosyltransferase-isomerase [Acidimicrobiales bacterium]
MDAYDYPLSGSVIAQRPAESRVGARLLIGPGLLGNAEPLHATVADLPGLLRPGDLLVVNDTRVLAARLRLAKATGGRAEVLLLEPADPPPVTWEALVRPGRRLPEGTLLYEEPGGPAVVEVGAAIGAVDGGRRLVRLLDRSLVERGGTAPLPPYIHQTLDDPERYQTVYARPSDLEVRSAAAPTAGLHFTDELLESCCRAGAAMARVDLAIGLDTFRPITAPRAEEHVIHSERYSVPAATMAACAGADRVIAVGTTVVRALETAAATGLLAGRSRLYIHGRFPFRVVDVLLTNFHLPRSSLLLLVEAFYGPGWKDLYTEALAHGYRFLSFGDAMVVGRSGERALGLAHTEP